MGSSSHGWFRGSRPVSVPRGEGGLPAIRLRLSEVLRSRPSASVGRREPFEHRVLAHVHRRQLEAVFERGRGDDQIGRGEPLVRRAPASSQLAGPACDWFVQGEPPECTEQALRHPTVAGSNATKNLDARDLGRDGKLVQGPDVFEGRSVSPEQIDDDRRVEEDAAQ